MDGFEKRKFISQGTVTVNGVPIQYEAVTEEFPVYGKSGGLDANVFTFSYLRSDLDDVNGRPVLFAWNGGPGAVSMYVHMGLLAPMKVKCGAGSDMPQTAPFELINNDNCLLDVCDVVSIDAIGTGWSRLINTEAKAQYASTQTDADVFAMIIRLWLTEHQRWNSPIYVMGESYGTIRTAVVAESMFYSPSADSAGVPLHLSGIINLGSCINHQQDPFPIPNAVLSLPSIAAAHWYWHPEGKGTLREFVDECDQFCYEEYVRALAMGSRLPEDQKRVVAEKLRRYTGYSIEKLLEDKLVVDVFEYPAKGMADEGRSIGIYDARFALDKYEHPEKYDFFCDDASNAIVFPAFSAAFLGLWKAQLNIPINEDYIFEWNEGEKNWNYTTTTPAVKCLENAMHRNPKMKVMFGMGYYDMLTTPGWVRYLVSHYSLPSDRVYLNYYEAGHMPYIGERQAAQLQADIKEFIKK